MKGGLQPGTHSSGSPFRQYPLTKTDGLGGSILGFGTGDPGSILSLCIALQFLPDWIWISIKNRHESVRSDAEIGILSHLETFCFDLTTQSETD